MPVVQNFDAKRCAMNFLRSAFYEYPGTAQQGRMAIMNDWIIDRSYVRSLLTYADEEHEAELDIYAGSLHIELRDGHCSIITNLPLSILLEFLKHRGYRVEAYSDE